MADKGIDRAPGPEVRELLPMLPPGYAVVNADGSQPSRDGPILVGTGASSVVVRAQYRERLDRAIKILLPEGQLAEDLSGDRFLESFDNETSALAELTHEHLAKLTDFGTLTLGDSVHPFIVTEFIPGVTLDRFMTATTTSSTDFMFALSQVLSALEYLHASSVMHCDVKLTNILVRRRPVGDAEQISAVLVDLGVSRKITKPEEDELDPFTYFFSTKEYVLPDLVPYLANETQNRTPRAVLRKAFPKQDLYSIGVVLSKLLKRPERRAELNNDLGGFVLAALDEVAAALMALRLEGTFAIRDVTALRRVLDRASHRAASPLGLSELSPSPHDRIALPTSRVRVPATGRVETFLNHPLMQRLHYVPQLDQLHLVFPGARHSRFMHALHTFDLARAAALHLLADWRFRLYVEPHKVEAFLFKALLDDVGHYHFVHMFEDFIPYRTHHLVREARLLSDVDVFRLMSGVPGPDASHPLKDVFDNVLDHRGRSLATLVNTELGDDWTTNVRSLEAPDTLLDASLGGLLSSPVDVDKLSYLVDDSLFAGLGFGRSIDATAIFSGLVYPDEADWVTYQRRACVGVRESVVAYLENAVLARYWQIQRGYWHRTNRSLQAMVKYPITELLRARRFDFAEFVCETLHVGDDAALRWLYDRLESARADGALDPALTNPLSDIVKSQRRIYKRLVTVSPKSWTQAREPDRYIFEALKGRSPMADAEVCSDIAEVLEGLLPGEEIRPGDVLLDLPRREREELGGVALVYADEPHEFVGDLYTVSPVLKNLHEAFDLFAKRVRVFIHPRLWEALGEKQAAAHDAALAYLRDAYVPER